MPFWTVNLQDHDDLKGQQEPYTIALRDPPLLSMHVLLVITCFLLFVQVCLNSLRLCDDDNDAV